MLDKARITIRMHPVPAASHDHAIALAVILEADPASAAEALLDTLLVLQLLLHLLLREILPLTIKRRDRRSGSTGGSTVLHQS